MNKFYETWEDYLSNLEDTLSAEQLFFKELQQKKEECSVSLPVSEGELALDVYQGATRIVVIALVAGVSAKNLEINFHNDILTIRGYRCPPELREKQLPLFQECYWGKFSRSLVVPEKIIVDKIEAILKNGLLLISLPLQCPSKKKILIKEIEEN